MELNGKAKDTVEQVQDLSEAKAVIAEAGMLNFFLGVSSLHSVH